MSYFTHAVTNAYLQDFKDEVTSPATWFLGLYLTKADRDGVGGIEPTVDEYERQAVTFDVPANSLMSNTATVKFPTPITTGGYGEIVAMGLFLTSDKVTDLTPRAVLDPPGGSFPMPEGYDREFKTGYITLEFRE